MVILSGLTLEKKLALNAVSLYNQTCLGSVFAQAPIKENGMKAKQFEFKKKPCAAQSNRCSNPSSLLGTLCHPSHHHHERSAH